MAMQQVVQINVVNVLSLPPGCRTHVYSHSFIEWKLYQARNLYPYSLHKGAWSLALEKGGFCRSAAWTDRKIVRLIRNAVRVLEVAHLHSHDGDMDRHRFFFRMHLASLHDDLRAKVKADLQDPEEQRKWTQLEVENDGPYVWLQDYEIRVRYHIGEDMGKAREVCRRTTTVLNMHIPANGISWLVKNDIDPGNSDLYQRLANDALVKISWWENIPAPLPGAQDEINLEVHSRSWRCPPSNVIRPICSPQCVECEFFSLHSSIPLNVWLPVLEGGWVIPSHHREVLAQHGFREGPNITIVHGEPKRTLALKETTLAHPVAVSSTPARAPVLVWRAICATCFRMSPNDAYSSIRHFC